MSVGGAFSTAAAYATALGTSLTSGDGLYAITVRLTDLAGNSGTYTQTVRLDTIGPTLSVTLLSAPRTRPPPTATVAPISSSPRARPTSAASAR